MKIYFDNCCLNRPYDDLRDNTVRMEAEAILSIIDNCESGEWEYFSSDVLLDEILGMSNVDKRERVLLLYSSAKIYIELTNDIIVRAKELEQWGVKSYDALHLASAEISDADILLSTDNQFISSARRSNANIVVKNPLVWLAEVLYDTKF
jgi:predicted nucleic acid-binding protein